MSIQAGKLAIGATLVVALVTFVAAPAASQAAPSKKVDEQDKQICEKVPVLGSRLAVKHVCMTRTQWEERQRDDRQAIDSAQRSPCVIQGVSSTGKPSC